MLMGQNTHKVCDGQGVCSGFLGCLEPVSLLESIMHLRRFSLSIAASICCQFSCLGEFDGELHLVLQSRAGDGHQLLQIPESWDAMATAVVVCDMWDAHHSPNATRRVGELAPRIDQFISKVRGAGGTVIHAPSSCMEFYQDHPARKRALEVALSESLPDGIGSWMDWIDGEEKAAGYPIDHSDGGEDDDPADHAAWAKTLAADGKNPKAPWTRQVERIQIDAAKDFITDDGKQNWSILESRGIENVILVGVHTNMCVLGRPFGLRQMAKNGKNVVLVRDLTDTMYNPAMAPEVSHFEGTDLIIEHVESYVCPTISSEQVLGGQAHRFKGDPRKDLLVMIGEKEYQTIDTLPRFAQEHLSQYFRVSYSTPDPHDPNMFFGLEALEQADVLMVSVRRRALPEEDLGRIRKHVEQGKPVVGIRTASHAFSLRGKPHPEGHAVWDKWDPEVFGGNYSGHHGNQLKSFAKPLGEHALLGGVGEGEFGTGGSLYEVRPLERGATAVLQGRAETVDQQEPVAWVFKRKDGGNSFYSSLGHVDDFQVPAFVKLLRNGICWAAGIEVGVEKD
ncbi:MAG: type 1 glutamine amidotransferase/nicotinamidase-related amidase [Verrucomicrobiales bacterium]|jgi:type 1 glutamine amidotransferase/nicotinamidase-related amidase